MKRRRAVTFVPCGACGKKGAYKGRSGGEYDVYVRCRYCFRQRWYSRFHRNYPGIDAAGLSLKDVPAAPTAVPGDD